MSADDARVQPFHFHAEDAALEDLRRRLRLTRWPDPGVTGWDLGTDVGYVRELVRYWHDEFDWRAAEAALGAFEHSLVDVDGLRVHVVRGSRPAGSRNALPLLLTHGWPDSWWRYSKVIGPLADPAAHGGDPDDAFDVIVPDLPGFGHSDPPPGAPLDSGAVAGLWVRLMDVLGHERFAAAGGDIGSAVTLYLALDHPDRTVAVHRMDTGIPTFTGDPADLSDEERDWLDRTRQWGAEEGGYAAMHRTKPNTLAVGLTDSPAGLASWIVEKLRSWSDCGGDVERAFTRDEILTLVTQYWLTSSIGSSMRMYAANAAIPAERRNRYVEVPSGFSLFAGDILGPPRAWLERVANVVYVSRPERGGHFAPFEQPQRYVQDLREFFRPFR